VRKYAEDVKAEGLVKAAIQRAGLRGAADKWYRQRSLTRRSRWPSPAPCSNAKGRIPGAATAALGRRRSLLMYPTR